MSKQPSPNCRARIDPELWRWVKYKAIREERTQSNLIEEIFREAKEREENRTAFDPRHPEGSPRGLSFLSAFSIAGDLMDMASEQEDKKQ